MMRSSLKVLSVLITTSVLIGCGGGDDPAASDDSVELTSTEAPAATTTVPPTTVPRTTAPPTTEAPRDPDLPEWASGQFATVETDTGPLEIPVEAVAFCETSRSFALAATALDFLEPDQAGTARQLFAALAALSPATIETAPSEEFAAEPIAARDQLAVIIASFEQIDYDTSRLEELDDPDALLDAADAFSETSDLLRSFLVDSCGADEDVLDEQARDAAAAAAAAAGETIAVDEPVEAVEGTTVATESAGITLSVPLDWTETEETLENGRKQLVASSDIDTFYGLVTPGVLVLRGEGGLRDGGFVGRVLEWQADLEGVGCVLLDQTDYDDGTYSGQERTFSCGTDGLDVRLLGGTTADESLYAMVFLVHASDAPGVRQLIVDTFQVS